MPYKFETDKLKIPRAKDKRVKLSLEDREVVKYLYNSGQHSQRQLAAMFGVSRRLITYYIDDNKLQQHKENSALRRKDGRYYDKDKHRNNVKNYRNNKNKLYKKGVLSTDETYKR